MPSKSALVQQFFTSQAFKALPPPHRQRILNRTISTSAAQYNSTTSRCLYSTLAKSSARQTSTLPNGPTPLFRCFFSSTRTQNQSQTVRPLVPPPGENSGPLLERMPNRELPDVSRNTSMNAWLRTIPIFLLLITASSLAIFNYQKSSSSTVNSVLYALRTNPEVREVLGDEIYFASKVPWISGELNQLHGVIDIEFWVKGSKGKAKTKFVSVRKRRDGFFETLEWSLKLEDGTVLQLLDAGNVLDPIAGQP